MYFYDFGWVLGPITAVHLLHVIVSVLFLCRVAFGHYMPFGQCLASQCLYFLFEGALVTSVHPSVGFSDPGSCLTRREDFTVKQ